MSGQLIAEAEWIDLTDPINRARFREWQKTLRRKDMTVVFATGKALALLQDKIKRLEAERDKRKRKRMLRRLRMERL
jgi:hypothetical protein